MLPEARHRRLDAASSFYARPRLITPPRRCREARPGADRHLMPRGDDDAHDMLSAMMILALRSGRGAMLQNQVCHAGVAIRGDWLIFWRFVIPAAIPRPDGDECRRMFITARHCRRLAMPALPRMSTASPPYLPRAHTSAFHHFFNFSARRRRQHLSPPHFSPAPHSAAPPGRIYRQCCAYDYSLVCR